MNREGDNKSTAPNQSTQPGGADRYHTENERQRGNTPHSHSDDIDQVEGRMNNGEIGSGITREDDDTDKSK
jgi:hypothetical protein